MKHVLINGWYAGATGTGSGQYVDHLLRALPAAAPEVRWSLLVPQTQTLPEYAGVDVLPHGLMRAPRQVQKLWWEQVAVPRVAKRIGADTLWVPYWAAPWWQPVPVVVTVHDLIPMLLPENRGGFLNRTYTRLVAATARKSARVIAVSHAGKRDIITHLGIAPEKVAVVWHGPNQEGMPTANEAEIAAARARYALPARYFLYLGGFEARKNLQGILEGYARYLQRGGSSNVRLVVAGKVPREDSAFTPDPRRIARDLGIQGQIIFPGFIDEADKSAVYAGATAYLFPSKYEGFGMMLLEAMQAGTPVITSG